MIQSTTNKTQGTRMRNRRTTGISASLLLVGACSLLIQPDEERYQEQQSNNNCSDGVDNDEDGRSDQADEDCKFCGNGLLEPPEECDDGNTQNGDGCQADCTFSCGDGVIDGNANEECDDTNNESNDGCSADCQLEAELFVLCDGGTGGDGTLTNPFHSLTDALQSALTGSALVIQVLPQSPLPCSGAGTIDRDIAIIGISDIFAPNLPPLPTIDGGDSPAIHVIGAARVGVFTVDLHSSSALGTAVAEESAGLGIFLSGVLNEGLGPGVLCAPTVLSGELDGALMLYGSLVRDSLGGGVIATAQCRGIIASALLRANGSPTSPIGGASVLGAGAELVTLFSVFDQNQSALHCDVSSRGLLDSSIVTARNGVNPISAACTTQFTLTQGINTPGEGNLSDAPLFAAPLPVDFFDYRLQAGSPGINAANLAPVVLPYDTNAFFGIDPFSNDAVFDSRPQGGRSDLGLFEDF